MIDSMPLFIIALGFVFTAAVVLKVGFRGGVQPANLGAVSDQWIAAHRASEPASSI
jgi:hypothetical protein